jgi:hypothetical protein
MLPAFAVPPLVNARVRDGDVDTVNDGPARVDIL